MCYTEVYKVEGNNDSGIKIVITYYVQVMFKYIYSVVQTLKMT